MDPSSVREVHLAAFGDHGPVVAGMVDDMLRDPTALSVSETEIGVAPSSVATRVMVWPPAIIRKPLRSLSGAVGALIRCGDSCGKPYSASGTTLSNSVSNMPAL